MSSVSTSSSIVRWTAPPMNLPRIPDSVASSANVSFVPTVVGRREHVAPVWPGWPGDGLELDPPVRFVDSDLVVGRDAPAHRALHALQVARPDAARCAAGARDVEHAGSPSRALLAVGNEREDVADRPVDRDGVARLRHPRPPQARSLRQPLAPPVKFQLARWRLGTRQIESQPPSTSARSRRSPRTAPGPERLEVRLREPHVRHRPDDPAVLDQPHAVAGQPGHDLGPRVEDPGVPEVGDEDAALDAGDQLVVVAVAGAEDEVAAERAPCRAALDGVAGALDAGRRAAVRRVWRSPPVTPSRRGRAAASACPRRRTAMPTVPGSVTSSRSVIDRSNCASPTRTNDRPSSTALPLKPWTSRKTGCSRRSRARARPRSGRARDRSGRSPRAPCPRRARPTARAVEVARAGPTTRGRCRPRSASGRFRRARPPSPRPVRRWPALFANASWTRVVEQKPAVSRPAGRVDERPHPRGPVVGDAAAVASSQWSTSGGRGRRREAGPVRDRPARRGRRRATSSTSRPSALVVGRPVERRRRDPPVERDPEQDVADVLGDVLVDEAGREAGQGVGRRWRTVTSASAAVARPGRGRAPGRPDRGRLDGRAAIVGRASSADPHPDAAESGRHGRVAGVADLLGLALAAVRRAPERPLVAARRACPSSPRTAG